MYVEFDVDVGGGDFGLKIVGYDGFCEVFEDGWVGGCGSGLIRVVVIWNFLC